MSKQWKPAATGNDVLQCDGFFISYNPSPGMGFSVFAGDDGSSETAIVADGKFYILNGDFREEYAALCEQGLAACMQFFASKPELVSSWSDKAPALEIAA